MWDTDPEPLPDWIKHAYDILLSHVRRRGEPVTREEAKQILVTATEFSHNANDAEFAVRFLLKRGWLYDVDGELRITNPDD